MRTLEVFARAIGDETRLYRTRQSDSRFSSSIEQRTGTPLASVDELRRMTDAVLVYANAPPAKLRLHRWDQVPVWRRLAGPSLPPGSAGIAGKGGNS